MRSESTGFAGSGQAAEQKRVGDTCLLGRPRNKTSQRTPKTFQTKMLGRPNDKFKSFYRVHVGHAGSKLDLGALGVATYLKLSELCMKPVLILGGLSDYSAAK